MRCYICENFSLRLICPFCLKELFTPRLIVRKLSAELTVYACYPLDEVSLIVNSKYSQLGKPLIGALARHAFQKIVPEIMQEHPPSIHAIPIDDHVRHKGSHSALLSQALSQFGFRPLYASLRAGSRESYAGKNYRFRIENPRNFSYDGPAGIQAVLVDDVVTTGLTMQEAKAELEQKGVKVLFGLVLADAREAENQNS